jgi:hypothetical protein
MIMKTSRASKTVDDDSGDDDPLASYSRAQSPAFQTICDALRLLIATALPDSTSKIWHGSPVWFIDENPVVGYSASANAVKLLFWNGQAFDEPGLEPVGKYRAAQSVISDSDEIDPKLVRRWLKKARSDIFDSRAFFKQQREQTGPAG